MADMVQILSPVGRMVQGHPMEPMTTNMQGGPLTDKNGHAREEFFFSVAFPKTDPMVMTIWQQLQQVAQAGFPGGHSQWPTFSWKVTDGDQPPHNTKEGFPGHYVFKFKSGFSPRVYNKGGQVQIVDKNAIKRGYFVRVYFNVSANGNLQKPGIYLNPSIVELVAYGEEIVAGPDGSIFGQTPVAGLPAGASVTPIAGPPVMMPGMPAPGMPAPGMPGMPAPGMPGMPGPAPVAPVYTPAPDFLHPPKTMTAKAAGVTYEAFVAQGWTDAQLITQGFMVSPMGNDVPF